MELLPQSFYNRDTVTVARDLLGKVIARRFGSSTHFYSIVETEAYRSDDPACHAYKGKTSRNRALFGDVGHTYVYICYGIHSCLNIVARDAHVEAGGVLIRAVLQEASGNRIEGPGRIGKLLQVTPNHNFIDVTQHDSELFALDAPYIDDTRVSITPRIGISKATDVLWRFVVHAEGVSDIELI